MANRFHKLKNNESDFPLIGNVDVYKFDNDFDYARYIPDQMKITMCTVPWDMGEAHIGARTISGIGNVVYFGSAAARDAWFDAIPDTECYRFATKYKELHRDNYIDVPVPFDVCAKFNYIAVEYELFANDDSPVMYEHDGGVRKWFWFIREVEFLAANNTRLHVLDDAFQTWIYDVSISGMILERGHAPMFSMKAAQFLANPVDNCDYLLTEDVSFGTASVVKHVDALALNAGTMYACIATTANPIGTWGSKAGDNWRVPVSDSYTNNGQPSYYVFAIAVSDLNAFLANVNSSVPQFRQTVQGVFFASTDLITLGSSFTFAGTACHQVSSTRKTFDLCELNKSLFGYAADYADIAKLYTSPYAHIEITDENGNVDVVRIEDSTGNIDVSAALSLAYPFITLDAHLMGVGGNASATVTYRNVSAHTFNVAGCWYETLRSWNVPIFAIVLSPQDEYDYATHFDRKQRVIDYTTAYDNANSSASTTKTNADASADTAAANAYTASGTNKTNADANADLTTSNATLTRTANTAITTASNSSVDRNTNNTTDYNFDMYDSDNAIISATATAAIAAAEQQAAVTASAGAASAAVGAIASAATGNIAGAVSSAVNGIIGAGSTLASTSIQVHLSQVEAATAILSNQYHGDASTTKTTNDADNQKYTADEITAIQNTLTQGQAANTSATMKANATRSQTSERSIADATQATDKANNARTYNTTVANAGRTRTQAQSDITNDIAQAGLRTPFVCGEFANGSSAANKPMALFANIVTQSKAAISSAGDEFLRYGYMFDKQWNFDGNWNVGKYFTYWKLRDFWVSNLNVPDMYMDKLRFFLYGGVTVWRSPSDIGKRTIYENFN